MRDLRNKLIIGGLFSAAVVAAMLIYTDIRQLGIHLVGFPLILIPPVLALTLFNYSLRWIKWQYFLWTIGATGLSHLDSAILWVAGFVLALSPGKIAEFLKAAGLKMMTGITASRTAPVILAERVTDGLAMLALAAISFGGILVTSTQYRQVLLAYLPAYVLILGMLIAGIVLIQIKPMVLWILDIAERLPLIGHTSHLLHTVYQSSYELFRPRSLLVATCLGIVSWAGECVGFFLLLIGLGFEPTWLLMWQTTFILAISTIVGAVSGLPGGLGAAEISIAGMIQLLILGHEDAGLAGTATVLVRLFTLWFGVGLGLITAFAFRNKLFPQQIADVGNEAKSGGTAQSRFISG